MKNVNASAEKTNDHNILIVTWAFFVLTIIVLISPGLFSVFLIWSTDGFVGDEPGYIQKCLSLLNNFTPENISIMKNFLFLLVPILPFLLAIFCSTNIHFKYVNCFRYVGMVLLFIGILVGGYSMVVLNPMNDSQINNVTGGKNSILLLDSANEETIKFSIICLCLLFESKLKNIFLRIANTD